MQNGVLAKHGLNCKNGIRQNNWSWNWGKKLGLPVEKRREREKRREEEEEEKRRRRKRKRRRRRRKEKQGMEFCMELVMICMDTCLEVYNTSFCVESLFRINIYGMDI